MSGLWITFEGIDGVGKSSILKKVASLLEKIYPQKIVLSVEPTQSKIGSYTKKLIFENPQLPKDYHPYLFIADRLLHLQEVIFPALKKNKIVICDRYHDSTIAYQGIDEEKKVFFYKMYGNILPFPHKTIWLDSQMAVLRKRLVARKGKNSFDEKSDDFFLKVQKNYQWLFDTDLAERIICIENNQEKTKAVLTAKNAIMDWIAEKKF